MKILFITAEKHVPLVYGGMQTGTDQLCHSLMERGHKVAVLSGFKHGGLFSLMASLQKKILRRKYSRDYGLGYPVWRSWLPWEIIAEAADKEKPDLIVVMAIEAVRMALEAKKTRIPIVMQLQDVFFGLHGGDFKELGNIPCIANSNFTAEKHRAAFGVQPEVIYPFMIPEKYKTNTTRENVTFINPHPKKGRDIALKIARLCPKIPFAFIKSWPLSAEDERYLTAKLSHLPNVTLLPPQKDMRSVYEKCKILLAPSICEEAYGRVATEAQMSGIPVIASTLGGLPEAVGPGGVLIDANAPIEKWVESINKLWTEKKFYSELSEAALAYAQRPEMSLNYQIDAYEKALLKAVGAPI